MLSGGLFSIVLAFSHVNIAVAAVMDAALLLIAGNETVRSLDISLENSTNTLSAPNHKPRVRWLSLHWTLLLLTEYKSILLLSRS